MYSVSEINETVAPDIPAQAELDQEKVEPADITKEKKAITDVTIDLALFSNEGEAEVE
jgi:hypothetical protein